MAGQPTTDCSHLSISISAPVGTRHTEHTQTHAHLVSMLAQAKSQREKRVATTTNETNTKKRGARTSEGSFQNH
jgi:hypothetical protein